MKKLLSIIAIGLIPFISISAQSEDSKSYLPKQGDIAFGINAKPILKYAGNFFNANTDNSLNYLGGEPVDGMIDEEHALYKKEFDDLLPKVSIMGKYMLTDNWGLRANVGLMFGTDIEKKYVQDDKVAMLDPWNESKLIDKRYTSKKGMSLMLGTEYRKGNNRVQGVFGMGAILGFVSKNVSYDYANAITDLNRTPSVSWNETVAKTGYRVLNEKTDNTVFYGVTGSAGVEWFVAPQIALGTEVNLSLCYVNGGQQYKKSEGYNEAAQKVDTRYDLDSPGDNKFVFGTENLGGSLYMVFYF